MRVFRQIPEYSCHLELVKVTRNYFADWLLIAEVSLRGGFRQYDLLRVGHCGAFVTLHKAHIKKVKECRVSEDEVVFLENLRLFIVHFVLDDDIWTGALHLVNLLHFRKVVQHRVGIGVWNGAVECRVVWVNPLKRKLVNPFLVRKEIIV